MTNVAVAEIEISWHKVKGRLLLIAYKNGGQAIEWHLSDYCRYLNDSYDFDEKTIRTEIFQLKAAFEQLGQTNLRVDNISDDWIKAFRDAEYARVLASKNSRGSEKSAKRTVNAKLRRRTSTRAF